MLKKIFIIGVVLVMGLGLFSGCGDKFETDRVQVTIRVEFREKFENQEFVVEDFQFDNIEKLQYGSWFETPSASMGYITIHLKEHGKKQARAAVKHLQKLDFVETASLAYYYTTL